MTGVGDHMVTPAHMQRIRSGVTTLHPGYFALVMATGIMSIGIDILGTTWLSVTLLWIAVASYVVLSVLSMWRLVAFRAEMLGDLSDPARAFGFFTFIAATDVVGARLALDGHRVIAGLLLGVATLVWLVLGYLIPAAIAGKRRRYPALSRANGSWFIWVVASQSIAVLAASLEPQFDTGRSELALVAVFSWSVGLFLYGIVVVLVSVRLFSYRLEPAEFTPPYWVAMGATAISVLAGSKIVGMASAPVLSAAGALISGFALLLWAFGTWLVPALLAAGYWRHVHHRLPLSYEPSHWSVVFPLGMYGVGSVYLGQVDHLPIVESIGRAELWVALVAWVMVFVSMLAHLRRTLLPARGRSR